MSEKIERIQQFLKQAQDHEEACRLNYEMAKSNTKVLLEELKKAGQ